MRAEYAYPATKMYTTGKTTCQIKKTLSIDALRFL
jgi:hypothetical protein